jgi:hypothetical protein
MTAMPVYQTLTSVHMMANRAKTHSCDNTHMTSVHVQLLPMPWNGEKKKKKRDFFSKLPKRNKSITACP